MSHDKQLPDNTARVVFPADLIGAATAAELLGVDKSTLTRRAQAGQVPFLAQLDGPGGAYVFDRSELLAMKPDPSWTAVVPVVKP